MKHIKMVFFGDSICVGQGISIHKGWVTRVSQSCEEWSQSSPDLDITITNNSVSGNTTRLAMERIPYHVQNQGFDIMITQFGLNDCNCWDTDKGLPRVSREAFSANLKEICARAKHFGIKKTLINTNHPINIRDEIPGATMYDSFAENNRYYNQAIREFSENTPGIVLVDIEKHILNRLTQESKDVSDIVLEDGIHLSSYGHDLYFEIAYPYIKNTLEELVHAHL